MIEKWRQGRGGRPPKTSCIHGHPFTSKNTYYETQVNKGVPYIVRRCRRCITARATKRYHTDPVYRETLKARSRARYQSKTQSPTQQSMEATL